MARPCFASLLVISAIALVFSTGHAAQVTADKATLVKLAGDFKFTEGPAADRSGNVFFTDQPNDRIMKWSVDGQLSTYMQPAGRANGLCFDRKRNLWAAADGKNELWKISPKGKVDVVAAEFEGKKFNGPNDIWITPKGGLYFSDPYYKRPYWSRGEKEMGECVYFIPARDGKIARVIDDLQQPNGIIGSPDGKRLFVTDIRAKETFQYDIQKDGSLTGKRLFCRMGSDGMTIDEEGNVYLTNKGVFVFSPQGEQLQHIEVPEPWTANVCIGGKNRKTLFITASKGLYAIELAVRGVGSQ